MFSCYALRTEICTFTTSYGELVIGRGLLVSDPQFNCEFEANFKEDIHVFPVFEDLD